MNAQIDILFLGLLYKEEEERLLLNNSRVGLNNSCNKFQWNIIKGLHNDQNVKLTIMNSLPCGNFPLFYKKLLIRSSYWRNENTNFVNKEIGFVNFYAIKHIIREILYFIEIQKWIKQNKDGNRVIIIYDIYLPFLKALKRIKKKDDIFTCLIIGDLPNEYGSRYTQENKSLKYKMLQQRGESALKLARYANSYILLTDKMKKPLKIKSKPYIVLEGIVDPERKAAVGESFELKQQEKRILMYAGKLDRQYGIRMLLDVFGEIENSNYELWLCGNGDMNDEIRRIANKDKRIKYYGYVSGDRLLQLEKHITAYINPRTNQGEYTKYSFPSKIIEYLASGKPAIMFKLDGIPSEYEEYIFFAECESAKGLKKKICDVLSMTGEQLFHAGKRGRDYVLNYKNSNVQASRVIEMIRKNITSNRLL